MRVKDIEKLERMLQSIESIVEYCKKETLNMATLYAMYCIASLNFKHINRVKTKISVEAVNQLQGYETPTICTPIKKSSLSCTM